MKILILFVAVQAANAQTTINGGRTILGPWDASGAASTRPMKLGTAAPASGDCDAVGEEGSFYLRTGDPATVPTGLYACVKTGASSWAWHPASYKIGTTAPATCSVGDTFFDSDATAGSNWLLCTASNTWTAVTGGSGATSISGLTDHKVTRTSATVATATPGQARVGETVTIYTDDCTVTLAASSVAADASVALFYLTSTGKREFGFDSGFTLANVTVAGTDCFKNAGVVTSPPAGSTPLARLLAGTTNDNWDAEAGWTNYRAFGRDIVSAGTALTESISGGIKTLNVNSAVAGLLGVANTWTQPQSFTSTATTEAIRAICAALPSTPTNGAVVCDSADSNQVKVRSNGAWVTVGSGGSYDPFTSDRVFVSHYTMCQTLAAGYDDYWNLNQVGVSAFACGTPASGETAGRNVSSAGSTNDLAQFVAPGAASDYLSGSNTKLWKVRFKFALAATTSEMFRVGITDGGGTLTDGLVVRYDTATDTAFKVCITIASTTTCQTNTVAVDTNVHTAEFEKISATNIRVTVDSTPFNFWSSAGTNDGDDQFGLTFPTGNLFPEWIIKTLTTAAKTVRQIEYIWSYPR